MLKYNAINWLDFGWDCLIKCSHAKTKPNHVTSYRLHVIFVTKELTRKQALKHSVLKFGCNEFIKHETNSQLPNYKTKIQNSGDPQIKQKPTAKSVANYHP